MTYFLEKYYELDFNGILKPATYVQCLVRPCDQDYAKVLDVLNGKMKSKDNFILLQGQVAMYSQNRSFQQDGEFKSVEEWLIWLELTKGISPDFEDIHVLTFGKLDDYIAKTTDLRTGELLFDKQDEVVAKLRKKQKLT